MHIRKEQKYERSLAFQFEGGSSAASAKMTLSQVSHLSKISRINFFAQFIFLHSQAIRSSKQMFPFVPKKGSKRSSYSEKLLALEGLSLDWIKTLGGETGRVNKGPENWVFLVSSSDPSRPRSSTRLRHYAAVAGSRSHECSLISARCTLQAEVGRSRLGPGRLNFL